MYDPSEDCRFLRIQPQFVCLMADFNFMQQYITMKICGHKHTTSGSVRVKLLTLLHDTNFLHGEGL